MVLESNGNDHFCWCKVGKRSEQEKKIIQTSKSKSYLFAFWKKLVNNPNTKPSWYTILDMQNKHGKIACI